MQKTAQTLKPSKQRRMLFQAPDHIRYKHFAAPLSPELRKSHGVRSLPVRSGDVVRITRGDRKGFEGKVTRVDRKKYRIYIEGLTREKVDGTTVFIPAHPSKVMITKLNLDDKWRREILEKRKAKKAVEKVVEKPPEAPKPEGKPVEQEGTVVELPPEKKKPKRRKATKKQEGEKTGEEKQKKKTQVKPRRRKSTEETKLG
ncbi:MAG: 50S ribosomal protein L24 [Candidatus Bathyarchaeia archaeon]